MKPDGTRITQFRKDDGTIEDVITIKGNSINAIRGSANNSNTQQWSIFIILIWHCVAVWNMRKKASNNKLRISLCHNKKRLTYRR